MSRVVEMMSTVYHKHFKESEDSCAENFIIPACNETLWGLGTTVGVLCSLCYYND